MSVFKFKYNWKTQSEEVPRHFSQKPGPSSCNDEEVEGNVVVFVTGFVCISHLRKVSNLLKRINKIKSKNRIQHIAVDFFVNRYSDPRKEQQSFRLH